MATLIIFYFNYVLCEFDSFTLLEIVQRVAGSVIINYYTVLYIHKLPLYSKPVRRKSC